MLALAAMLHLPALHPFAPLQFLLVSVLFQHLSLHQPEHVGELTDDAAATESNLEVQVLRWSEEAL